MIRQTLFDRDHLRHFRNPFFEIPFDPNPQRHIRRRTPDARPMHLDLHDPIVIHFDELDVAPVILNRRPNPINHKRYAFVQGFGGR